MSKSFRRSTIGKLISAQRLIIEELKWQEVQIQLEKQLVDESSGVMHSTIRDDGRFIFVYELRNTTEKTRLRLLAGDQ